jgi:hypothetical protein
MLMLGEAPAAAWTFATPFVSELAYPSRRSANEPRLAVDAMPYAAMVWIAGAIDGMPDRPDNPDSPVTGSTASCTADTTALAFAASVEAYCVDCTIDGRSWSASALRAALSAFSRAAIALSSADDCATETMTGPIVFTCVMGRAGISGHFLH